MATTIKLTTTTGQGGFYSTDEKSAAWYSKDPSEGDEQFTNVGNISKTDSGYSYEASAGVGAQIISTEAKDTNTWFIYGTGEADTITAAAKGDASINGGAGNDVINLNGGTKNFVIFGATSGNDTVNSFADDVIFFEDGYGSDVSVSMSSKGTVEISQNGAVLTVNGESGNDMTSFLVSDASGNFVTVQATTNGGEIKTSDVSTSAYYSGKNISVDFSSANNDNVVIDLGNSGEFGDGPVFNGVVAATGATNSTNKMIGAASTRNTLQGGAGSENSLWGGGTASDYLVGGSKAEDVFYYGEGDGSDSIASYTAGEDVVNLTSGQMQSIERDGGNVVLKWSGDGTGKKLTLVGGTNTTYTYTTGDGATRNIAFSTKAMTYSSDVDDYAYVGTSKGALSITGNDDVKLWLDGSKGDGFSGISVLNAKNSTGSLELAGSASGDSIVGGKGASSLWGGAGGNDTMVGGSGENAFYFGVNEGKDVITSYNNGDKVMLYNVDSASVASAALSGKNMVITLNDGSKLTINNYATKGDMSFALSDGTYTYDKSSGAWNKA